MGIQIPMGRGNFEGRGKERPIAQSLWRAVQKQLENLFGLLVPVGPRNHVIDAVLDCPMQRCNFCGKGHARAWLTTFCHELLKMNEPIEMPFGLWSWVGPRQHVLDWGPDHPITRGNF